MAPTLATEADCLAWDAYVEAHPDGLAYHRWAWKEAVERAYGFECLYLLAEEAGVIRGVLPLVHHKAPFAAGTLVSLPYCDVGGVLADDAETAEALVAEALRWARRRGAKGLELRNAAPAAFCSAFVPDTQNPKLNTQDRPSKVRMLLDLPASSEALLASFKAKHRSQVKKPERDGLRCRLGGTAKVDEFYEVFAENMRDLGSPVHSRWWMEEIVNAYGENCRVGVTYLPDGTPGAAGIILLNGTTVSIPWASSLRRYNRENPNMLLYWTFLAFAADQGFRTFDFGRSTVGEGTYKFKEQWGARPVDLVWATLGVDGVSMRSCSADGNGRLRQQIEGVWRKLPRWMCDSLGARLRRYVSL